MKLPAFRLSLLALVSSIALPATLPAAPQTFNIDAVHSGVSFKIRHFFNRVPGTFGQFSGTIVYDAENPSASSTQATIAVASVDTRNDGRDEHLQNDDFFKANQFPSITFQSTSFEAVGENRFRIIGDLTMVGVTKSVVLDAELLGVGPGRNQRLTSGWTARTTIDRTDWGLSYGQGIVGNEVEIELEIQGHAVD